jgi:WD40 repeat protein
MKKTSVTSVGLTTAATSTATNEQQQSALPQQLKVRLYHLFGQIEKEFELIYAENQRLQKQTDVTAFRPNAESTDLNGSKNIFQAQNTSGSTTPPKTLTKPIKPNKIQNNLFFQKFPKQLNARDIMQTIKSSQQQNKYDVKPYATIKGLRDGVWDVCCAKTPEQDLLVGTACADSTSSLWLVNSNNTEPVHMVQQYCGHTGSVNSIRLHPKFLLHNNLVLTGSGDHQAHIWQYVDNGLGLSSDGDFGSGVPSTQQPTIANTMRMPICKFEGHTDACIAADWFPDCENIATASWDRTANIYNIESGKIIRTLQHDDQLTNVTLHPSSKIILTSSKDTTFKIWDLRDFVYSVNIYQGHTRSVNSAVFITDDKIATTSDDQTCKVIYVTSN